MNKDFWRRKRVALVLAIIILVPTIVLVAIRIDYGRREQEQEDAVLKYFSQQEGMPETFAKLEQITPSDAVVLCWWDYGRAVNEWSQRTVIESYPSRDIWHSVGASRDPWHNLGAQLFGTWGSSERIHDLATIFMLPEEQALPLMKRYNVSYALVFTPDELQKFSWIAEIAGYNGASYLIQTGDTYQPTDLGAQVTLLRLLFDETLDPQYFTKIFDNGKGKIYSIRYA